MNLWHCIIKQINPTRLVCLVVCSANSDTENKDNGTQNEEIIYYDNRMSEFEMFLCLVTVSHSQIWRLSHNSCLWSGEQLHFLYELHIHKLKLHAAFTPFLTCKGADVPASCDHLWIQWLPPDRASWGGRGGGGLLQCGWLNCRNPLPVGHTGSETF